MQVLLTRILWIRRSKWQFLLAGFAFMVGLSTLMLALDAFLRVKAVQEEQNKLGHFLMLNKKISMVNTLGIEPGSFEKAEIDNIRKSGLFQDVGEVYSNKFRAQIYSTNYIQFQTLVFFEAVHDPFLDSRPVEFRWSEGQKELPIIVSQDFLNLYNFGFALGQGLPQMGKETLKLLSFSVQIDGPGGKEEFTGRVVGFTDRITSVLVPVEFMHRTNRKIGNVAQISSNRVLVKVANPSNPEIGAFLKKFRLSTSQEKMQLGKPATVLDLVMKGLAILGFLFSLLALVMFSTNFRLVMAEAESDIRLLIELGYAHRAIAFQLLFWFLLLISLIFILSGFFLWKLDSTLALAIQGSGFESHSFTGTCLLAGFGFAAAVVLWNASLILNHLRKIA